MAGRRIKKNGVLNRILGTSLYFLGIFVAAYILVNFVVQRATVIGRSMENTMYDGDEMLIDKITYKFRDAKRFELVVFPQKGRKKSCLIKRIIGIPGETVRIDDDGIIYVNDRVLNEKYGAEVIKNPGIAKKGIKLDANEYFVLGDNRNDSIDSRFDEVGIIRESDILGRVIFRIKPLNRIGVMK